MGLFKKILDGFKAENESGQSSRRSKELNNQIMLKELMTHFKSMLEYESFGRRMLYPMSFTILMNPEDYRKRLPYLPLVVPEIVAAFYSVIESKRRQFPNFEPPANYWYFQFVPCDNGIVQLGEDMPAEVEPGKILTIASLTTPDAGDQSNTSVETNTRVSVKLENSNVNNDVNLNMNALRNLNVFGEGTFTCDFDMALDQDHDRIRDNSNIASATGLAELSYSRDGRNYHYVMKDNLIHISGDDELRRGRAFFIIEGEKRIRNSHVQIRYLPTEKKFQIAAFGPARLNSGRMEVSGGGNVIWYDLANNSSIFIDGLVSIRFVKK